MQKSIELRKLENMDLNSRAAINAAVDLFNNVSGKSSRYNFLVYYILLISKILQQYLVLNYKQPKKLCIYDNKSIIKQGHVMSLISFVQRGMKELI